MSELKLWIPTYNGNFFPDEIADDKIDEYGKPEVPVTAYQEAGLRVVLGTHDPTEDFDKPDLLIERQPHAWAMIIHPDGGDPSCLAYILDDGRTFLIPQHCPCNPGVQVVDELSQVPGLKPPQPKSRELAEYQGHRTFRFIARRVRDLGVIGAAIRNALSEIHRISTRESLAPDAMERIVDKHISRLARPIP